MGRILLAACTNVGRYIIEELINNQNIKSELVGIVNLNQEQALSKANYDSYTDLIYKYKIPIFYCNNINDNQTVEFMKDLKPDIIIQSGWSQKFSDYVLNIPTYCCIGEHPAPLPRGRGAACVNWAILTGETEWGDSYFRMVQEYDKGELFAQRNFKIEIYDNVFTIYEKVATCAAEVIAEYADKWSNGIFETVVQDDSKATYYKRRRPKDGEIKDFSQNAEIIHNFIRAQTFPYPGAYFEKGEEKIIIISSKYRKDIKTECPEGTVISTTEDGGILIACGDNSVLEILHVKRENRPLMWAADMFGEHSLPTKLFE